MSYALCLLHPQYQGRVVGQGSYKELVTSGIDFASLVLAEDHDDDADSAIDEDTDLAPLLPGQVKLDHFRQSKPNRWSIRSSRSFEFSATADLGNPIVDSVDDVSSHILLVISSRKYNYNENVKIRQRFYSSKFNSVSSHQRSMNHLDQQLIVNYSSFNSRGWLFKAHLVLIQG